LYVSLWFECFPVLLDYFQAQVESMRPLVDGTIGNCSAAIFFCEVNVKKCKEKLFLVCLLSFTVYRLRA
jgi:hypothetical protein